MMAKEVDSTGRVIVDTTTKERAELKQDQIHAFGPDPWIPRCQGRCPPSSSRRVIEAACGLAPARALSRKRLFRRQIHGAPSGRRQPTPAASPAR